MTLAELITLSPEFTLVFALIVMLLVNRYRETKTPKTFYTVSKIFLLLSAFCTLLFYNKSGFPEFWLNNTYTSLFKICMLLLAVTWFFLSCKWFLNKNHSSLSFYLLGVSSVLMLMIIISSQNLLLMQAGITFLFVLNYLMIYLSDDDFDVVVIARRYLIFAMFFAGLFAGGLSMVYYKTGSFDYIALADYLSEIKQIGFYEVVMYVLIMAPLLFLIGLAPFHFWFADVLSVCVLPICGFLTVIPVFAGYSALVDLSLNVFYPLLPYFKPVLVTFAALSLLVGAVSANRETNLRKLFAYNSLYHLGFVFITLASFNYSSIAASFVYLLVYILSMIGIYTVFFGFKSNGEYLYKLEDISGVFTQKPYISTAFLVFMISLAGSPPMLGFLGKLIAVNNLVIEGNYWSVGIIMMALLLLINAYLDVIRTVFFEQRKRGFDRVDKGIYICLFINIVIVLISILNPGRLIDYLEKLLSAVL